MRRAQFEWSGRCSNAPLLWQVLAQRSGVLFSDPYLAVPHLPGERSNSSGVDDLKLTEMIRLQRRTFDVGRRREIIWDIQRQLAEQVFHSMARQRRSWQPARATCGTSRPTSAGTWVVASWPRA